MAPPGAGMEVLVLVVPGLSVLERSGEKFSPMSEGYWDRRWPQDSSEAVNFRATACLRAATCCSGCSPAAFRFQRLES